MSKKTIFFVVGRLGDTLVHQKIRPFIESSLFERVFVFRENPSIKIKNAKDIILPSWLVNLEIKFLKRIIRLFYEPIQLYMYVKKIKPDYINGIFTLPKGLNAVVVGLLTGTKTIVSVIGGTIEIDTYYRFAYFWKRLNLWMLKKTNIVTTTGSNVTNYLVENKIKKNKIFEFPGAVDTDIFYFDENIQKDIDILFVGTFRKLKGPDKIVKMINQLKINFPNITASFVGTGYLFNYVKNQIKDLGIRRNITLEGYKKDTVNYFKRAKILVMPSRSEGLSMAMLEAMACGCVPIVSAVGNMTDAAKNGINSFVVDDYQDIYSFSKYIAILLSNNKLREKMAKNGRNLIRKKYSMNPQAMIAKKIIEYGEKQ